MKKYIISFLLFFLIPSIIIFSQATKINNEPDETFKLAKEYYLQGKLSLAYSLFKNLYYTVPQSNFPEELKVEVNYYFILSSLEVNDAAAEPLAKDFIELELHTPRIEMLSYHLAEYFFRRNDIGSALTYYNKCSINNLTNQQIATFKFHKGYALFTQQKFDEAKPLLDEIRQLNKDSNYVNANYYYGFISFSEKKYNDALNSFQIAVAHTSYQNIVPFYIAEIYYFAGNADKALSYAEQKLKEGNQYYSLPLEQLAGHLWFDKKEYAKAYPYLQDYIQKSTKVKREDLYELSYCYYAVGNWQQSITGFKQLGGQQDSLAQNSMYLLADAYLKVNDKANARNAFLFCSNNNSNPTQKEASAFNYAKLSYELGYTDIALQSLQMFVAAYPTSNYLQEAKELGISVLTNTSNYKQALILYNNLPSKSENIKKVYPRILYGRVVELINDQSLDKANELLNILLQTPYNEKQIQLAYFWKGEIEYRTGNTDAVINYSVNYLKAPQMNGEVNAVNAKYTLAYALLKKEQYANALDYFQQITSAISSSSSSLEQDAYTRSADCYFMQKNYKQALQMYNSIIAANSKSSDYAQYQKAIISGAAGKQNDKINQLQELIRLYPSSNLIAAANIEIANAYLADENYAQAISPLQQIIKDRNASALYPKAYLKLGVANFNLDKNTEALNNFTKLVVTYPNSSESDEAIEYIRNIFIEQQQPNAFIKFMNDNGKPISYAEGDSLTFRAAQLKFDAKDFKSALMGFENYRNSYPEGKHIVEANYLAAEMYSTNKDVVKALPLYLNVMAKAPNKFAEKSALQVARIYYFENKDFNNAATYYQQLKLIATQQENRLEAMRGLLRCQYKTQQWKAAVNNAQDLLQEKTVATDDKMMANLIIAKSYQLNNELDAAINAYKQVTVTGKSEFSAEAQYSIAEILLQQNKLTEAEKAGFETIKKYGSYENWVTKSYILLGDVYYAQKDWFNAEATFKSVADNATDSNLKNEAKEKLAKVLAEKNKIDKVD